MKKTKEKYIPTEEDITQAYGYCDTWKGFFHITQDDVQDIIMKFFRFYDPERNDSINAFTNMLIKQHLITDFRNKNLNKNKYEGILQLNQLDFESRDLAIIDNEFEERDYQSHLQEQIQKHLKLLKNLLLKLLFQFSLLNLLNMQEKQ